MLSSLPMFINIGNQILVIQNEVEGGLFFVNINDTRVLKLLFSLDEFFHDVAFADTSLSSQNNQDAFAKKLFYFRVVIRS